MLYVAGTSTSTRLPYSGRRTRERRGRGGTNFGEGGEAEGKNPSRNKKRAAAAAAPCATAAVAAISIPHHRGGWRGAALCIHVARSCIWTYKFVYDIQLVFKVTTKE